MFSTIQRSASFASTDITAIKDWSEAEKSQLCLTIYIDVYFLEIAVCPRTDPKKAIYIPPIEVSNSRDVYINIENLSQALAQQRCEVVYSTMSFAGPLMTESVMITNWDCDPADKVITFNSLPFDLFPLERHSFMNDLEAASYGLIARSSISGSLDQIFLPLWGSTDPIALEGPSLVISVGSGCGVAFIYNAGDSCESNCVVASECSHSQVVICRQDDPYYKEEYEYIKFASNKLYSGDHMIEWEDLTAVNGLVIAYQYIKYSTGKPEPDPSINYKKVREMAQNGSDPDAISAIRLQYRFVIRGIQSFILAIPCRRVFVLGADQVEVTQMVLKFKDELKKVFEDHPRREWFSHKEIYLQAVHSRFQLSGGLFLSRLFADAQTNC